MRKLLSVILVAAILACFALFALGSTSSEETPSDQGKEPASTTAKDDTTLGDYKVEIKSCRLAKDYEGKDVAIIKYGFTNVSDDDPAAFMFCVEDYVSQSGVELESAIIIDDSADYDSANQMKKIKKGASLDLEIAYVLNDTTTDILVEVKKLFSFSDDAVLTKTFSLS